MSRAILIYVCILPLALFSGYMLATPTDLSSFTFLGVMFLVLLIPILLKSHHFLLTLAWNSSLIVFFLPGQPQLGTAMAFVSLGIAIVTRTMSSQKRFLSVPSVTVPLIVLGIVVLVTAKLTGGIGSRVLGAETWGARRYLGLLGAIAGYFALIAQPVPLDKVRKYFASFFLGGLTTIMSDLIFMAGPAFYFLFLLFPSDYATSQAFATENLNRLSGISFGCVWLYYFLIGWFGIEKLFSPRKPWRLLLLTLSVVGALLGGYRGLTILMMLIFVAQFLIERVHRKGIGPVLIFTTAFSVIAMVALVDRMPLSVQRAFSFLPLERINPVARLDALGTLDWRLQMWKLLVPEIPKYLFLGKGYGFNGTDYYLTQEAIRRGMYSAYEDTLVTGNYHNGILTLLIPFGIWGFLAFLWFARSALMVLIQNYRYSSPELYQFNRFLLAWYCTRLFYFLVFYGQFDADLYQFTGIVGLSIALNGGLCPKTVPIPEEEVSEQVLVPIPSPAA